jgi:hypothetical protein
MQPGYLTGWADRKATVRSDKMCLFGLSSICPLCSLLFQQTQLTTLKNPLHQIKLETQVRQQSVQEEKNPDIKA